MDRSLEPESSEDRADAALPDLSDPLHFGEHMDAVYQSQDYQAALPLAERFVARYPRYALGWIVLCGSLSTLGRQDEALDATHRFIATIPQAAGGYRAMGRILVEQAETEAAIPHYERSVRLDPSDVGTWRSLAFAHAALDHLDEAIDAFDRVLDLEPFLEVCLRQQIAILDRAGRHAEAIPLYQRLIALEPAKDYFYITLTRHLTDMNYLSAAALFCKRAIHLDPESLASRVELGLLKRETWHLEEALKAFMQAHLLDPGHPVPLGNAANVLLDLGRPDEAWRMTDRATLVEPDKTTPMSNRIFTAHYDPKATREDLRAMIDAWVHRFVPEDEAPRAFHDPDPDRPLTIGMVSSGFMNHPALALSLPAFEALDTDTYRLIAYSDRRRMDFVSRRLAACAEIQFVANLDDAGLADQIRKDKVDILIDMSGHAAGCRLRIIPMRPAPVQVKWVGGLFNTSGVPGMDWLIADAIEVPHGEERWYSERIYRMPDGYVVFCPPDESPPVWPLPAQLKDRVTFGSFNNPNKINDEMLGLWARILHRVPDSRLMLKGAKFSVAEAQEVTLARFARHGIDAERIILRGFTVHSDQLRTFNEVDIALDPWPYSGGLTTCECLWMGVPVITWPGPTFAGRHAASHLNNVGLSDWIVDSADAYVELAVSWANRVPDLAALRQGLRARTAASPLCDGPRFARNLEKALRFMWQTGLAEAGLIDPASVTHPTPDG
ncbi:tetratricopeptide repeat protein [Roseospira visakhapatnamensis]|uniref:protein O-GlcNAc transferase n=1 Tax=Roseospira visakhapatnamensis TaxID=390880 RepID=A0A7W6RD02_9PROT|nr:glycosyltransferase family 41 protein [Roseospira visakhapatnamensis]MBB4266197.1 putative O-linked N-acetylglucosamine transferase (SPINDLY family) [Roseospira visakhapatnamensis]